MFDCDTARDPDRTGDRDPPRAARPRVRVYRTELYYKDHENWTTAPRKHRIMTYQASYCASRAALAPRARAPPLRALYLMAPTGGPNSSIPHNHKPTSPMYRTKCM